MRLMPRENPLSVRSHCGLNPRPSRACASPDGPLTGAEVQPQELASRNRKRAKTGEKQQIK
jgi:hypothetical protein